MNIQIFGTKKSFDTKKAQRYFKERRIKFQFIDLKEKGMSKGELESVMRCVGGIDGVLDVMQRTRIRSRLSPIWLRARSLRSCLRTNRCCVNPSSVTAARRPWATSRMYGRAGSRHFPMSRPALI